MLAVAASRLSPSHRDVLHSVLHALIYRKMVSPREVRSFAGLVDSGDFASGMRMGNDAPLGHLFMTQQICAIVTRSLTLQPAELHSETAAPNSLHSMPSLTGGGT